MIKKILNVILIFFFLNNYCLSETNISIEAKVNDRIITNIDIYKEIEYLKILNPNLKELDEKKIFELSKNSLINQLVKEIEIEKFFDLKKDQNIDLLDRVYLDLIKRLNINSEEEFDQLLMLKKSFSIYEIKNKLKIELFWNDIIFAKYKNQVKINKEKLLSKIEKKGEKFSNEYLLSEIFFKKEKDIDLENLILEIKKSINEIGFNNTANIYSLSESAKFGGNIGWVSENNLSKIIYDSLNKKKIGEYTNVIKINNNFLILKIEDKRTKEIKIDKNKQLSQMINFERNKQLNQFSNIYFNKIKINNYINEK